MRYLCKISKFTNRLWILLIHAIDDAYSISPSQQGENSTFLSYYIYHERNTVNLNLNQCSFHHHAMILSPIFMSVSMNTALFPNIHLVRELLNNCQFVSSQFSKEFLERTLTLFGINLYIKGELLLTCFFKKFMLGSVSSQVGLFLYLALHSSLLLQVFWSHI